MVSHLLPLHRALPCGTHVTLHIIPYHALTTTCFRTLISTLAIWATLHLPPSIYPSPWSPLHIAHPFLHRVARYLEMDPFCCMLDMFFCPNLHPPPYACVNL